LFFIGNLNNDWLIPYLLFDIVSHLGSMMDKCSIWEE